MLNASQVVLVDPILERVGIICVHADHLPVKCLVLTTKLFRNAVVPDSTYWIVTFILGHKLKEGHILYDKFSGHVADYKNERGKDLESAARASPADG